MEPLSFGDTKDEKYLVFKTEDFQRLASSGLVPEEIVAYRVPDAIVIRRQDYFASPALAGYAASIAIAAKLAPEEDRKRLLGIADYFESQAQLAADEGWKLPD